MTGGARFEGQSGRNGVIECHRACKNLLTGTSGESASEQVPVRFHVYFLGVLLRADVAFDHASSAIDNRGIVIFAYHVVLSVQKQKTNTFEFWPFTTPLIRVHVCLEEPIHIGSRA